MYSCTVQLYIYSPYGPYCLYTTSVPVQYSYTSTPPTDRTACTEPHCLYRTSLPVQYSYTSTPPIGRTTCTEPHCLYCTAVPLLPLWTVLPVQNLSACTRVKFTFFQLTYITAFINKCVLGGNTRYIHISIQEHLYWMSCGFGGRERVYRHKCAHTGQDFVFGVRFAK